MRYLLTFIATFFVGVSCFAQSPSEWSRANADDGLVEKDTYCLFSSIKMGQSMEWIQACRGSKHVPSGGQVSYFDSERQMAAVADLIGLWYMPGDSYEYETDDFILWRLSAYMPAPNYIHSTRERFDFLTKQIDSLLHYEKNSQWDYNLGAYLEYDLVEFYAHILEKELVKINAAFRAESNAYDEYLKATLNVYSVIVSGPSEYDGSSAPMRRCDYMKDRIALKKTAIEPFLFYLSDNMTPPKQNHGEFTPELVNQKYDKYIASLKESEDEYPLTERKSAIELEKQKWNEWLAVRQEIKASLPVDQQSIYQQQTDALCRYQYVVLKNRNIGYGLHPASLDEHLIHHDWSDERILSAVDAYTAYYLQ